jgi:hypothetical protein
MTEETLSEREWKMATNGDYWFVPEDSRDRGAPHRKREFPFFIYEVPIHEGDEDSEEYEEPVGYAYVVCPAGNADEAIACRFETFEDAQRGAEEWFKQTAGRRR